MKMQPNQFLVNVTKSYTRYSKSILKNILNLSCLDELFDMLLAMFCTNFISYCMFIKFIKFIKVLLNILLLLLVIHL